MATFDFGAGQDNYTGEVLNDLLTYTAQENETYKNGLIHIKSGIQKKYTLPGVTVGKIIQDRKPTPDTSVGEFLFAERYLEPEDFMVYIEFNPRDFEEYYKPFQPEGNLVFRELDPRVQATMLRLVMEKKAEYINQAIWQSATTETAAKITDYDGGGQPLGKDTDAGPTKYYNGLLAKMLINSHAADGTEEARSGKVQAEEGSPLTTGEEIREKLYSLYHACKPQIRYKQGLKFLMDYQSWDLYDAYMSGQGYKYTDDRKENQLMFRGHQIVPLSCLPASTILLGNFTTGTDSALWMGVDYADDENVVVVDRLQANSELYFLKILMKMDVNITRPSEITAYLPFTYSE